MNIERGKVALIATGVVTAAYLGYQLHNLMSKEISAASDSKAGDLKPEKSAAAPDSTGTLTDIKRTGKGIANGMTGAVYEVVSDPKDQSRQCVKLGHYSPDNKQDVTGAAVALGTDPAIYVDVAQGSVYSADGTKIGSFNKSTLPDPNIFGNVPPNTVVCEN